MSIVREQVASSAVRSLGYDPSSQILEVEFTNGKIYQYYNVGEALFEQLQSAPSKGQFVNAYIRPIHPFALVG